MKKSICLSMVLLTLLCLIGCKEITTAPDEGAFEGIASPLMETDVESIEVAGSTVYILPDKSEVDLDAFTASFDADVIPNHETAVLVAKQIFDGTKIGTKKRFEGFVPTISTYYEKSDMWVVTFTKPIDLSGNKIPEIGEEICIALQKSDGRVLKIWLVLG
ncbi:MAG: hypothetical protein IKT39_03765 [Clostridia bacterium]|nr:hypothetical protein [Clostridia bacterium]